MAQGIPTLNWRRLLFAVGALIVVVNLLSAIWDLRNSRAVVERDALRDFNNLSGLLADQTARSLEAIGLLLHQTAGEIDRAGVGDLKAHTERLRDRIAGFPRIRSLVVLNREGHVVITTDRLSKPGTDFSDRSYFHRHVGKIITGAYVSEPFIGVVSHRWSFALSERINDKDGNFAGVVAAVVDISYFDRLYESLEMGASAFVALLNRDGSLVTRVPPRPELYGRQLDYPGGVMDRLKGSGRYSGWASGRNMDKQLLVSAAPVSDSPLVVVVGANEVDVLAPWKNESLRVIVRTLLTSAFMLALVWLAARELARREATERLAAAERERMQQRLRQSEKMEAIGRLAGGIAHDFNNVLGGIIGYAEMLLEDLHEGSREQGYAKNLLVGARRARDLVEQILAYSRPRKSERRPVDLARIVRETIDMVRGSLPGGIVLNSDISIEGAVTLGDATQLHEVVMNLCTNAIQAMGDRGTLIVVLGEWDFPDGTTLSHGSLAAGRYLMLRVADTGVGMDEATMSHLFEPFFTTKEDGRGTGLGLAMAFGIVADSGGAINVASRVGLGSSFSIFLPRSNETPAPEVTYDARLERGHGERVLLVDDESALLTMMTELLRRLGYDAHAFADPREALDEFRKQPEEYDLVLTDEAMPGLQGTALAREVKSLRADIPVIIVTGRAEESLAARASEAGVREVLLKPIEARELAGAMARALRFA